MIMNFKSYQISDSLKLIPITEDESLQYSKDRDKQVWVHIQSSSSKVLEDCLEKFGISTLTKRLLKQGNRRSGFYPFADEILIMIPILSESGKEAHLGILFRNNILIAVHKENIPGLDEADLEDNTSESWLHKASVSALLSAIFMDLSIDVLSKVDELKVVVESLEQRLEDNVDSLKLEDIMKARTQQLLLESIVFGQSPAVAGLKVLENTAFKLDDAKDYLNCSSVNQLASKNLLDRLENRILDLRSRFQMNSQEKGNRRLNILSIISTVFLPTTFLAGFWGMNFPNMPMINSPYGIVVAGGTMITITIGLLVYLFKREWFK